MDRAPASGVWRLPAGWQDPELDLPLEVAVVDGCFGLSEAGRLSRVRAREVAGKGLVLFREVSFANGDSYAFELVPEEGDSIALESASARRRGAGTVHHGRLARVARLEASDARAVQALLRHESAAVRAAALERLLRDQEEESTCAALAELLDRTLAVPGADRALAARLLEAGQARCLLDARSLAAPVPLLLDAELGGRASETLGRTLTPAERARTLLAFVDAVIARSASVDGSSSRSSGPLSTVFNAGTFRLLPPAACSPRDVDQVRCTPPEAAARLASELKARAFRPDVPPFLQDHILSLFSSVVGQKGTVKELLPVIAGTRECPRRLALLEFLRPRIYMGSLEPADVAAHFPALLDSTCPDADDAAAQLLAGRLRFAASDEAYLPLVDYAVRVRSARPQVFERLRKEFYFYRRECFPSNLRATPATDALARALELPRCAP
jgi:hypothetical protein